MPPYHSPASQADKLRHHPDVLLHRTESEFGRALKSLLEEKQEPCSLHEMCSEKWPVMFLSFPHPHFYWVGFLGCFWVFQIDMTNSTSNVETMLKQKRTSPEDQNQYWSKCVVRSSPTKYQNLFNPIRCRFSTLKKIILYFSALKVSTYVLSCQCSLFLPTFIKTFIRMLYLHVWDQKSKSKR